MASDVVGIGLACVDHLFIREMQVQETFHRVKAYNMQGGGLAATAMATVGKLGGKCEIWTRVGQDPAGDFIVSEFARFGVDTSAVSRISDAHTPVCGVIVDTDGERRFNFFPGSGLEGYSEPDYARIDGARCILVDAYWPEVQVKAMERARQAGVTVVGDFGYSNETCRRLMKLTDIPIISEECAAGISPTGDPIEALKMLVEWGARVAVVTLGPEGSLFLEKGVLTRQEAIKVDVVDTTGAGDAFHGAYCFGLTRGWKTHDIVRFATVVAGLNCRGLGGRTGLPTFDEAMRVTRESFPKWSGR